MSKAARQQDLKKYLLQKKKAGVDEMSRALNVTPATIRGDLSQLEKEGYLVRYHGGASLNSFDYQMQEIKNAMRIDPANQNKDKAELGLIASSLINEKEWIFLGPGTTTYYIALALTQRSGIHVLTNNLLVANALGMNSSCEVRLIGGTIHADGFYTLISDFRSELENVFLSKAFFSVDGADLRCGYTLSDANVLDLFDTVYHNCAGMYMVLDSSKYDKRAFMKLRNLDFSHELITNESLPEAYLQYYQAHDIPIHNHCF